MSASQTTQVQVHSTKTPGQLPPLQTLSQPSQPVSFSDISKEIVDDGKDFVARMKKLEQDLLTHKGVMEQEIAALKKLLGLK
jgi:hypothetical protein